MLGVVARMSSSRFVTENPSQTSSKQEKSANTFESVFENVKNIVSNDINAKRNEYIVTAPDFVVDMFISKGARRKGGAELFYCLWNTWLANVANVALVLLVPTIAWQYIAVISSIRFMALGAPRFTLGLHAATHAGLFQSELIKFVVVDLMLGVAMGIPCGWYEMHHIVMHHKENNIFPLDISSTMPYQRDNFLHFLFYWARFEIGVWVEMPYWLLYKGYYSKFVKGMLNLAAYCLLIAATWNYVRPAAAIWLILVPQFAMSFLLMIGNWFQHILIDPENFDEDYALTVNLLDTPYNSLTFNDGYHCIHHKYPYLSWRQMPHKLLEEKVFRAHGDENALCFRSVDWFWLGLLIFFGQLDVLFSYFVPVSVEQSNWSSADFVREIKRRITPIFDEENSKSGGYPAWFGIVELLFAPEHATT